MAERPDLDVEYFAPTTPQGESRSETLARIITDEDLEDSPGRVGADPTTASNRPRGFAMRAAVAFVAGAAAGAVVGLLLFLIAPGPLEGVITTRSTGGLADAIGFIALLSAVVGVVVAVLATLMMFEREDGRTEEKVEEHVDEKPPPPAG